MSVFTALRKRFPAPAWAYFEEVRNGTGYARRTTRTADALAFSLWPSRGIELHGVEVKVSRGDWLRERDNPEKAEEIGKFCNRWWLATEEGVVEDVSEVPPAWGWLCMRGKKLVAVREAPLREAKPLDLLMVASILRRASETQNARVAESVQAQVDEAIAERLEAHQQALDSREALIAEARRDEQRAANLLRQVESGLGVSLRTDDWPKKYFEELPPDVAEKLRAVSGADLQQLRSELQRVANQLRGAAVTARQALRSVGVRAEPLPRWGRR